MVFLAVKEQVDSSITKVSQHSILETPQMRAIVLNQWVTYDTKDGKDFLTNQQLVSFSRPSYEYISHVHHHNNIFTMVKTSYQSRTKHGVHMEPMYYNASQLPGQKFHNCSHRTRLSFFN